MSGCEPLGAEATPERETCIRRLLSRRSALQGAAVAGAGLVAAACGGDDDEPAAETTFSGIGNPAAPTTAAAAASLGSSADVPVGGGRIYKEQRVVVTQPTAGTFKAFSAECTHQGCLVSEVVDAQIRCTCHLSAFSIADGAVLAGPAPAPLPPATVTESEGALKLG